MTLPTKMWLGWTKNRRSFRTWLIPTFCRSPNRKLWFRPSLGFPGLPILGDDHICFMLLSCCSYTISQKQTSVYSRDCYLDSSLIPTIQMKHICSIVFLNLVALYYEDLSRKQAVAKRSDIWLCERSSSRKDSFCKKLLKLKARFRRYVTVFAKNGCSFAKAQRWKTSE